MLQEEDFHFCLLISQQGLYGPPPLHLSLSFPESEHTLYIYKKKEPQIKKPPILRPNPSHTGFYSEGGNRLTTCSLSFVYHSLFFSLAPEFIYPDQPEKALFQRLQARCNGGENAIVPCSCFAQGTEKNKKNK